MATASAEAATRFPAFGRVVAVSASPVHGFSKQPCASIQLIAGMGVEGDAHAGATTQHRYLRKKDPGRPNLTQVHLLHAELFEELAGSGFRIAAGQMGENITTQGIDLLTLPVGTKLHFESASEVHAVVEVTGLREPCSQLNQLQPGLMKELIGKGADGRVIRRAGIMGVVLCGGLVQPEGVIRIELPERPWTTMGPV